MPPNQILPKYYYFHKRGGTNDFYWGDLLKSVSCDVRFYLRRFNATMRGNLKCFNRTNRRPCRMSVKYMRRVLRNVLPIEIFGSMHNFSKFMKIIAKLCTASIHENIPISEFTMQWKLQDVKWLPKSDGQRILTNTQMWLITWFKNKILKKMFNIQIDTKNNMIVYTPKKYYQSLYDKAMSEMVQKKQLLPCEKELTKSEIASRLIIVPKDDALKYRPLVVTKLLSKEKQVINRQLRRQDIIYCRQLYSAWKKFVDENKNNKIYGVKMDLRDAFSNVNIDVLVPLLKKYLTNPNVVIDALVNQPILCYSSTRYIWNRGLMQGMAVSQDLCNLNRNYFDKTKLINYVMGKRNSFFNRTVDDYMYCSTNINYVNSVANILSENCIINENKTERDNIITYMGRKFNMDTKEVEININKIETYRNKSRSYYTQHNEVNLRSYLFKICNIRCNAFNFNKILFNLTYNSPKIVFINYFKAMITIAFKVECAVKIKWQIPPKNFHVIIQHITRYYIRKVKIMLMRNKPKETKYNIPNKLLEVIAYRAFILVLQQRYAIYEKNILILKSWVKGYKHRVLREIIRMKLPEEFKNVRVKRVLQRFS